MAALTNKQIHLIWAVVGALISGGAYMGGTSQKSESEVRQEIQDSLMAVSVQNVASKIDRLDTSVLKLQECRFMDSLNMAKYMEKTDTMLAEIKRVSTSMKNLRAQGEMGLAWARK